MCRVGLQLPLLSLFLLLLAADSLATEHCKPSSCGGIPIKPPFRLTTDPRSCGNHNYSLSCESNATVLYLESGRYYVKAINYNNFTIRLVDDGVVKDNISSFPAHPLSGDSLNSSSFGAFYSSMRRGKPVLWIITAQEQLNGVLALVSCDNPVVNSTLYAETAPRIRGFDDHHSPYSYAMVGSSDGAVLVSDLADTCRVEMLSLFPITNEEKINSYHDSKVPFREIHRRLEFGFQLSWLNCSSFCPLIPFCYLDDYDNVCCLGIRSVLVFSARFLSATMAVVLILIVVAFRLLVFVLGTPAVIALLVYKWRRRHGSAYRSIEEFLQNQTHLMPVRYSYYRIKKMTGGFKDKLGQGGFASVYKAKLRSGSFAAVKLLDTSNKKASTTRAGRKGQDFMNEVATIGRIHHANVVRLIGYCSDGSKQALVYEFMPNGSLDKHISHHDDGGDQCSSTSSLSLEQLYRISLGVACGIEYLHRGCEMQILHFDIKPHNILLDENFTPKVSDFGLARLNQAGRDNNIATLTAARGTIGYMAPELFYKNIGGVSYKADVYSFGMLLLEMVGKRRNLNTITDQSSAYFPAWVHNQVTTPGTLTAVGEVTEEEENIAKKMVMVGLWCIQVKPDDRPPMNKVVEMLEGDLDSLQLPPKPAMYDGGEAARKHEEGSSSSFVSSSEYTQSSINALCDD